MKRELDQIDIKILMALQKNARLSNKELAAEVGLAESSCLERVRRVQREKLVRGFHAELDHKRLGVRLQAMLMVRLRKHSRDVVESFRDKMLALPEVVDIYLVAGAHDFMIHVLVPDADYLRRMELDKITTWPEVVHIETSLIFEHRRDHSSPIYLPEVEN